MLNTCNSYSAFTTSAGNALNARNCLRETTICGPFGSSLERFESLFRVDSHAGFVCVIIQHARLDVTPAIARKLAAWLLVIADRAERQASHDAA